MPSNQKKVRDIERAIKKFGSTPELLAKLEEAKHGKEEVLLNEKRRKNATKYHMVKFLERKKMTRMIRSTESKLKQATDEEAKNRLSKLRDRQMNDLAYVMYYPIEHKYIALFPSAEKDTKGQEVEADSDDDADGKQDAEKSKQLSKKARQLALERWNTEKQNVADGVEGAVDKVAYAMEVEYKGGVAAAEGRPQLPKQTPAKAAQSSASKTKNTLLAKADTKANVSSSSSNKPVQNQSDKDVSDSSGSDSDSDSDDDNKQTATKTKPSKVSGSRDSDSESDSSSDSSDSDSDSDSNSASGAEKTKKNTVKPAVKKPNTTSSATASAKEEKEKKDEKDEPEEDAGDDFFMEEASDSEILAQAGKNTQPKVYNDGNDFRYKGERQSVHEIRFAATKRKYERHKRVFNNQNKRNSAQERKKSRN